MKYLDILGERVLKLCISALRVTITSISFLLIWIRMFLSVGFVTIGVGIFGALCVVLVLLHNYNFGTPSITRRNFIASLLSLWKEILENQYKKSISRMNSLVWLR